jgi:predicted DNA-binding protein (MmcQ/YjbR family)
MNPEALRKLCLSFEGASEGIKWNNHLCFMVRHKMFCILCLEPPFRVSFKTRPEDYRNLTESPHIIPAPYLARYHWVQVTHQAALTTKQWTHYLTVSYELITARFKRKPLVLKLKNQ